MMKKIWKAVFIIAGILGAVGIICLVAGFVMGGSVDELMDNERAKFVITWLSPANQLTTLLAVFGI